MISNLHKSPETFLLRQINFDISSTSDLPSDTRSVQPNNIVNTPSDRSEQSVNFNYYVNIISPGEKKLIFSDNDEKL